MSVKNITRPLGLLLLAALCSAALCNASNQAHQRNHNDDDDLAVTKNRYDYIHVASWPYVRNATNFYSPIDIPAPAVVAPATAAVSASQYFKFHLKRSFDADVTQNLVVAFNGNFGSLKVAGANGQILKLAADRFQFRAPAGHLLNGRRYDGEARFYFKSAGSSYANYVVSVLLRAATSDLDSEDVFRNTFKSARVRAEPIVYQSAHRARGIVVPDAVRDFFAAGKRFFRYVGSSVTPPFDQNVTWFVFEQPLDVSRDDIEFLRYKYSSNKFANGGNSSPIQPLNGRAISYNNISLVAPVVPKNNSNNNNDDDCDSGSDSRRNGNRNHDDSSNDNRRNGNHGHDDSSTDSYRGKRNNKHSKHY